MLLFSLMIWEENHLPSWLFSHTENQSCVLYFTWSLYSIYHLRLTPPDTISPPAYHVVLLCWLSFCFHGSFWELFPLDLLLLNLKWWCSVVFHICFCFFMTSFPSLPSDSTSPISSARKPSLTTFPKLGQILPLCLFFIIYLFSLLLSHLSQLVIIFQRWSRVMS